MKEIEIPLGAKDSELKGWEYTIPEGIEAEIKDGKIVVREKKPELTEFEEARGRYQVEWSEEDAHNLARFIEKRAKAYEFNLPNRGYDIFGFAKDILKYLRINQEKVEWSEEDIDASVKSYSDSLPMCGEFQSYHDALVHAYRQGIVNALKSLKPQPKQEWSDEDIEKNLIAYLRYERKSTPQEIEEKFIPYIKRTKIMEQESISPMSYGSLDEAMQEAGRRFDLPCTDKDKYSVADVFYAGVRAERESKQEWNEEEYGRLFDIEHYLDGTLQLNPDRKIACIDFLKSLRSSWKPSEQEKGALRTAIHILTDERSFPKAAAHLQNILDAFEGKESRKDWKPSEEQMEALQNAVALTACDKELTRLYNQLKKLI